MKEHSPSQKEVSDEECDVLVRHHAPSLSGRSHTVKISLGLPSPPRKEDRQHTQRHERQGMQRLGSPSPSEAGSKRTGNQHQDSHGVPLSRNASPKAVCTQQTEGGFHKQPDHQDAARNSPTPLAGPPTPESETLVQELAQEVRQLGSERQRVQELRLRLSQEADLMEREKVAWATRKASADAAAQAELAEQMRRLERERRVLEKQGRALLKLPTRRQKAEVAEIQEVLEKERQERRARDARHRLVEERLKRQLAEAQDRCARLEEMMREVGSREQKSPRCARCSASQMAANPVPDGGRLACKGVAVLPARSGRLAAETLNSGVDPSPSRRGVTFRGGGMGRGGSEGGRSPTGQQGGGKGPAIDPICEPAHAPAWRQDEGAATSDPEQGCTVTRFSNGDIHRQLPDGTEQYWYSEVDTWQIQHPSGVEVVHHADAAVEASHPGGLEERLNRSRGASWRLPGSAEFVPISRAQLSWEILQPRPRTCH
ncbi:hypothetical protein ACKKBG_A17665 [Auxenochlorella protothecoides x Auxenochlorella symbiontica]